MGKKFIYKRCEYCSGIFMVHINDWTGTKFCDSCKDQLLFEDALFEEDFGE